MKATTSDGREVLLMKDGTWKYDGQPAAPANYDCNSLTQQMEGNKSAAMSPIRMQGRNGTSLAFYPQKEGEYVTMLIEMKSDDECMKTGSIINFAFRDGTLVDLKNSGEANCDGRGSITLGTNDKANKFLTLLKTKELVSVRVWGRNLSVLVTPDPEQSKLMLNTMWCLLGR
jgi:hypothetical protein